MEMKLAASLFDGCGSGNDDRLIASGVDSPRLGFNSTHIRRMLKSYLFFLNLYSTPTEIAKLTSNCEVLGG